MPVRPTSVRWGVLALVCAGLTIGAYLFVSDAEACLSRDFVMDPPRAICWRKTNDYESASDVGSIVELSAFSATVVCTSAASAKWVIRRAAGRWFVDRRTVVRLGTASLFLAMVTLLATIVEAKYSFWTDSSGIWRWNGTVAAVTPPVIVFGAIAWLSVTTMTIYAELYRLKRSRQKNSNS